MTQGPRIYNLFPLLAGPLPRWTPHLQRARGMEFNWIFVNAFHQAGYSGSLYSVKDYYAVDGRLLEGGRPPMEQLRGMLAEAEGLGMAVMMDLVINHTAFDSPLVARHPDWFVRDADGRVVHPGATDGEERVAWGDVVQVDNADSPDREALWAYWRDLALHYAGMGFRGFRCDAAYQVPQDLWRHLIGAVKAKHPDVRFFAETLGCTPEETLDTAAAGFDFIFNSSKWWDFREPWCLEQYAVTAPVVPSISFPESHDTPRLAEELDGERAAILQRYAFAATFSTGVMMPIGFEFGFRRRLHVVETTPADWEAPRWDFTGAIAAVNRTKAAHPILHEEGPIRPVDLGEPGAVGLLKRARHGRRWVLVALNLDREAGVTLRMPPEVAKGGPLAWTDPGTARSGLLADAAGLTLPPSGVALVHPPEPGGPSPAAAGGRTKRAARGGGAGIP
jgi:starch synthase (maltosyl-transferring)